MKKIAINQPKQLPFFGHRRLRRGEKIRPSVLRLVQYLELWTPYHKVMGTKITRGISPFRIWSNFGFKWVSFEEISYRMTQTASVFWPPPPLPRRKNPPERFTFGSISTVVDHLSQSYVYQNNQEDLCFHNMVKF